MLIKLKLFKMKKLIYSTLALVILMTAGCKKEYFDINQNPNSPTDASISPELILPRALHATAARMATSYDYAAHWTGYWARSGTYGPSNEQESYAITTSYQAGQWSGWYDILFDANTMQVKATASNQPFYVAAAKVIKSIGFMYLVDQYDNVPYSKAFDVGGNILPAYDKGQAIYTDLLLQLDEAGKAFATVSLVADPSIKTADIMFKGDLAKWRKLVNIQRLKLLLRQSQVFGATAPTAQIAKITADGSGFLGAGETASVQPSYATVSGQQNPFWNAYKTNELGAATDDYNRANNFVLGKFRGNSDIRYKYVFSASTSPIAPATDLTIYYGYNFGENVPNSAPKAANSSAVSGPGLAKSNTQAQWLFTSVESLFLQAEAKQRGWITGDAETAYKAAVTESFTWLGVTEANAAATYLAQGTPFVDYTAATNKVNLIVMQKYMALTGVNNFEAYVDYRRLGVPTDLPLSLNGNRGSNVIPTRLLYPQAEYNYNAANVGAEGTVNAQTGKVFWDK
jgi:hypothetical protein